MVDQVLQALAEPRRREILKLIRFQELSVGEIASHFDVTRPAISQHLGVLSSAGLVTVRQRGTSRFYRVRPEGLTDLRQFLEGFWDDRLELLVREAEAEERRITEMTSVQSDVVVREVRISARPETVFGFLTDPALMVRWMGKNVQLEPHVGGIYWVDINGEAIACGEFIDIVPNQRVSFSFGWEGDNHPVPPGSTVVEITLTPDGDATIVRLEHSGLPADARADHGHGWQGYVDRLAAAAEGRDPGPDPNRIVASER